jgi:hypothetical protein
MQEDRDYGFKNPIKRAETQEYKTSSDSESVSAEKIEQSVPSVLPLFNPPPMEEMKECASEESDNSLQQQI